MSPTPPEELQAERARQAAKARTPTDLIPSELQAMMIFPQLIITFSRLDGFAGNFKYLAGRMSLSDSHHFFIEPSKERNAFLSSSG
jgi:hypothetical protein